MNDAIMQAVYKENKNIMVLYIKLQLRKLVAHMKKIGMFGEKKIQFVTALDLIKCL